MSSTYKYLWKGLEYVYSAHTYCNASHSYDIFDHRSRFCWSGIFDRIRRFGRSDCGDYVDN